MPKPRKILLVEDELSSVKVGLEMRGFIIDAYHDPTLALSGFKPGIYGIAILDIRMPNMNGFELYRRLREIDPGLGVCFFTAFDVHEREFEMLFPELKAKALFRKPIRVDELALRLNQLFLKEEAREFGRHPRGKDS